MYLCTLHSVRWEAMVIDTCFFVVFFLFVPLELFSVKSWKSTWRNLTLFTTQERNSLDKKAEANLKCNIFNASENSCYEINLKHFKVWSRATFISRFIGDENVFHKAQLKHKVLYCVAFDPFSCPIWWAFLLVSGIICDFWMRWAVLE